MNAPFRLFSWTRPFLPALKDEIDRLTDGCPGNATVIVPHRRPRRYLYQCYADEGAAMVLPRLVTLEEAVRLIHVAFAGRPLRKANPLDQVALLHDCIRELGEEDAALGRHFATMDIPSFLPWGMRLAAILEEMLKHGVQGEDIGGMEYDVGPQAAALLGGLGRIRKAYLAAMGKKGWTTPGMDHDASCGDGDLPPQIRPCDGMPVVIAGFHLLSGTEDRVLRRLWDEGAEVCLHTDSRLALGRPPHTACAAHMKWVRRWGATLELVEPNAEEKAEPRVSFFRGYDVHSQMDGVRKALEESAGSTVIVLNDTGMLMPLLHHLPDREVNISMGYPLARSSLCQFIENLLRLHEESIREEGGEEDWLHWRSLLRCLRHPFLKALETADADGEVLRLEPALLRMEQKVRGGERFVRLDALVAEVLDDGEQPKLDGPTAQLLEETIETVFRRLASARTPGKLSRWLAGLCRHLLERGGGVWQRYPLDSEALFRLRTEVVPMLARTRLRDDVFRDRAPLFAMMRDILAQDRIPFEADPLTGLQVMGMLETRMLHFDRVLVVEATDGFLPGTTPTDPLLPQSLRQVMGLPDVRDREAMAEHNLYRLCAGANEVHFFWEEGGLGSSSILDDRSVKSRFVERYIWEAEKAQAEPMRVFAPGEPPLEAASYSVRPPHPAEPSLECTPRLREKLDRIMERGITASFLDAYLRCPLAFARRYLDDLSALEEVNEGDNPMEVGNCLHDVLKNLYAPLVGRKCRPAEEITRVMFDAELRAVMKKMKLDRMLPPASCFMLEAAAGRRLWMYLKRQVKAVEVLEIESKASVHVGAGNRRWSLWGRIDRLERREDGLLHILDYKSGAVRKPMPSVWEDEGFFSMVKGLAHGDSQDVGGRVLERLREDMHSLQLPCYVAMVAGMHPKEQVGGAHFVALKENGREVSLFSDDGDEAGRRLRAERCALLVAAVAGHLSRLERFEGLVGDGCQYCDYACLCS